jgi:hypothetical protein
MRAPNRRTRLCGRAPVEIGKLTHHDGDEVVILDDSPSEFLHVALGGVYSVVVRLPFVGGKWFESTELLMAFPVWYLFKRSTQDLRLRVYCTAVEAIESIWPVCFRRSGFRRLLTYLSQDNTPKDDKTEPPLRSGLGTLSATHG